MADKSYMDMMAAMSSVGNVRIDPETGRKSKVNGSILPPSEALVEYINSDEYAKRDTSNRLAENKSTKSLIDVYTSNIEGKTQIPLKEDVDYDTPLSVGKKDNETAYMAELVRRLKRKI